jgi:hypothetical protein
MKFAHFIPAVAIASLVSGSTSFGQTTFVSFNTSAASYVSANATFDRQLATTPISNTNLGGTATQDVWSSLTLDKTTPQITTGYTGPLFYGGAQSIRYDSFGTSSAGEIVMRIQDNGGTGDYMRVRIREPYTATGLWEAVNITLFSKANFLNGGNAISVGLDSSSSLFLDFTTALGATGTRGNFRFIVQNGSQLYVSNSVYANNGSGTATLSGSALLNETWAFYNPTASDLRLNTASFSAQSFNDITAVGFAWTVNNFSGNINGGDAQFGVDRFTFAATTAIPEPSTYAALAGLAALGLVMWRRRRHA